VRLKPLAIDDEHPKSAIPRTDPVLSDPLTDIFRGALSTHRSFGTSQLARLKQGIAIGLRQIKMHVVL
jgi:hypothetical protein